jgi:3-deoxy-7-phosphoheptulonate synthase
MLIVMRADATRKDIEAVVRVITELGFKAHVMPGPTRTAIGITGNKDAVDSSHFENMHGVAEAIRVSKPYKLTSLDLKPEKTIVRVGDSSIGEHELAIIAGPCAVESREQTLAVAEVVHKSGAQFFRGGVFKPRTPLTAFQGLGEEGLEILAEVRERYGLKIVTEAVDEHSVELVERYADIIQIGARNMQNFSLLRHAGRARLPILLKRGLGATIDEWLLAAEYVMVEGNYNVILCERGVRTFSQHTEDTLDLAVIPAVRSISHLPLIIDPSHGTGKNYLVAPLARAGAAVGIDGLIVEVNEPPSSTRLNHGQELTPDQYMQMVFDVRAIHEVIIRENGNF